MLTIVSPFANVKFPRAGSVASCVEQVQLERCVMSRVRGHTHFILFAWKQKMNEILNSTNAYKETDRSELTKVKRVPQLSNIGGVAEVSIVDCSSKVFLALEARQDIELSIGVGQRR